MASSDSDLTQILEAVSQGENSSKRLLPMVYEELRKLAHARMLKEQANHTLQATALVHEAWLRLAGSEEQEWDNRGHFFAAAAEAMRRVLIDRARSKGAEKHGGGWERVGIELIEQAGDAPDDVLLQVNEAVDALSEEDPEAAKFVKLRFFAGLTVEEASLALGISERVGYRYWRFARIWLLEFLQKEDDAASQKEVG